MTVTCNAHLLPLSTEHFGGVTLNLLDWGPAHAARTVVCVHGLTRNAHDFDWLAESLAATGVRVLAFDMPGRGDAPRLENPMLYGYPLYVSACIAALDNFHLRSVDWVGTSMGGIIGMMIAASQPTRIRRLVLNDIGAHISREGLERIIAYVSSLPKKFETESEAHSYLRTVFTPFGITDEAVWQSFIGHSIRPTDNGSWELKTDPAIAVPIIEETKKAEGVQAVNLSAIWESVACPTLILRGEHSDLLTPETMKAMLASNFRAESETIAGCGHAPSLSTPAQIQRITRFLAGADALRAMATGA